MEIKPSVDDPLDAATFDRWYWPKPELEALCVRFGLPRSGGKDALRARILHWLKTGEVLRPAVRKPGTNWSKATLTTETRISEDISFGPNVRRFFKAQIGARFSCHSDFMDWVRGNPGKTLGDAVAAWHDLEARKDDPSFRREIAPHNNYLQYLRDFRDANPGLDQSAAKQAWETRKAMPIEGERIVYRSEDAHFPANDQAIKPERRVRK
ncbi:DUF6434 domain-containing protein [Thalassococcus sp. S3]|uniref:DUF6434 domain-containing protein n=1 Tax=Thalassococcus sp. S3 TaxID=2017482 RepID=UPI001024636A|nr:DUF6434 domain-containing protein [Thalassococcus sp. S3]QBF33706.1 hypothetical protein CFI11_21200 [Thalassococcus sp. S3]